MGGRGGMDICIMMSVVVVLGGVLLLVIFKVIG